MEVRISKLENTVVQFMDQRSKKNFKKSEDSLRDLKDIIMLTDICIVGVPNGKEKERGRKLFQINVD